MRVVLAPDSFKESLSAKDVAEAMRRGVLDVFPGADTTLLPQADGGEDTLRALKAHFESRQREVSDPLGRPVEALWGWQPKTRTALIEAAEAAGLENVPPNLRDVENSSSVGVGELIGAALDDGARSIVIAVGGTATNDGGAGMLSALGVRFLDADDSPLPPTLAGLAHVARVDISALDSRLHQAAFTIATDVDNPLCGPQGASAVYGPQKGVPNVQQADRTLGKLADAASFALGTDLRTADGAGSGGGIGWAALQFFGAKRTPGARFVADLTGLADAVRGANLVITGEGSVDGQTMRGKTVGEVLRVAKLSGVPTVVLAPIVHESSEELLAAGALAVIPLGFTGDTTEADLRTAAHRTRLATRNICGLYAAGFSRAKHPKEN